MNKIKFIVLISLLIILYQIPFLDFNNRSSYTKYVYVPLIIIVWSLGTRKIEKDTTTKKLVTYGFGIFWCLLIYMIEKIKGYIDIGMWIYSPIIIFVISRILLINKVKCNYKESNNRCVIISVIMFIIGFGIMYFMSQLLLNIKICEIVNVTILIIQLFNIFRIRIEEKSFILISVFIMIIVLLVFNIMQIQEINKISNIQEEIHEIIENNQLTYLNISDYLGTYVADIEKKDNNYYYGFTDLQNTQYFYDYYMRWIKEIVENINRKNFKEYLEQIQLISESLANNIEVNNINCKYRILSLATSIILVVGMSVMILIDREDLKNKVDF